MIKSIRKLKKINSQSLYFHIFNYFILFLIIFLKNNSLFFNNGRPKLIHQRIT
jgi:hypothetical protein